MFHFIIVKEVISVKNRNIKHIIINTLLIIMIVLSILTKMFMFALTPYQDWDVGYKYKVIDYDKLDLLQVYWRLALIMNIAMACFLKSYKKIFSVIYWLLALISLIMLGSLFFV